MKRNVLNLFIALLTTMIVISSCTKDKFPPSLSLELEPYVIYYGDTKYTLYDTQGNIDPNVPQDAIKMGDIQSYIDTSTLLTYVTDDKGEFWTAGYLNNNYKYPGYRVSGYGENTPTVTVTFDDGIGIVDPNTGEIDLGLATSTNNPFYTFLYTATDDGETTTKKVNLRVYNSYYSLSGLYVSCASLPSQYPNPANTLWLGNNGRNEDGSLTTEIVQTGYKYGKAKAVKIDVDASVNLKMKINRLLNNSNLKGAIKGESETFPSSCVIGDKKKADHDIIEKIVEGPVHDYDIFTFGISSDPLVQDTIETLVVITNILKADGTSTGSIKDISVKDSDGNDIQVPLITLEYRIERYSRNSTGDQPYEYDGHKWWPLISASQKWTNSFRETFIKQVYWTEENKDAINQQSGHETYND